MTGQTRRFSIIRFFGIMLLCLCLVFCPFLGAVSSYADVNLVKSGSGLGGLKSTLLKGAQRLSKLNLSILGLSGLADPILDVWNSIFGGSEEEDADARENNYNTWITNNNYYIGGSGSFTYPLVLSGDHSTFNGFSSSGTSFKDIVDGVPAHPYLSDFTYNSVSFAFIWGNDTPNCTIVSPVYRFKFPCKFDYSGVINRVQPSFSESCQLSGSGIISSNTDWQWSYRASLSVIRYARNYYVFNLDGFISFTPYASINADVNTYITNLTNNYYDNSYKLYDYSSDVTNINNGTTSPDGGIVLLNDPAPPEVNPQALWYRLPSINFPDQGIGHPITDLQIKMPNVDFTNDNTLDINDVDNYITLPDGEVVPVEQDYSYDYSTRTFSVTSSDDNSVRYSIEYGDESLTVNKYDLSDNSTVSNVYYYAIYEPEDDGGDDSGLNGEGGEGGDGGNGGNGGGSWTPVINTSGGSITFSGGNFDVNVAGLVDLITAPFRAMYQLIEGLANALMESVQSAIALMSDVSGYVGVFMDYVRTWFSWLPEPVQAVLFSGFGIFFTVSVFRLFRGG